jgi:hypothetical protein
MAQPGSRTSLRQDKGAGFLAGPFVANMGGETQRIHLMTSAPWGISLHDGPTGCESPEIGGQIG